MTETGPDAPVPKTARFADRTTPPHIMTLVLAAGMGAMSMNMFLPSLPAMTAYFQTEYWVMQLSVSLYLAVNAVLQLLIGPLSDRYGRRPVLLGCTLLFTLATVGTLLATTVEMFLLYRMGQAVIVAGIVLSRAVVRDMVPGAQAAAMIGYVTMGMAIVPMIGPTIGGLLDESFGWRANFWLLLLCGLGLAALIWVDLGETAAKQEGGFAAQVRAYPELLTSPRFWGYCAAAACASGAFFAYLGGAPWVATEVFGLSPGVMGLYFGFPAGGYALGNFASARLSTRVGINRMVLWGTLITCTGMISLIVLYWLGATHPGVFFGLIISVGLGNGLVMPNTAAGMLSVRPKLAGSASGLGGAILIGGGAALSALAGVLLTPGSGPYPLMWLMLATSFASVLAILYVIRRERRLNQG